MSEPNPNPAVNKPGTERALDLIEMALADPDGITVLGWADDGVLLFGNWSKDMTFTVFPGIDTAAQQEESVLILAVRVPHPDSMGLEEVVGTS